MDEFHATAFAPRGPPAAEYEAIRRTLDGWRIRAGLKRAVRRVLRRFAALNNARVAVTRWAADGEWAPPGPAVTRDGPTDMPSPRTSTQPDQRREPEMPAPRLTAVRPKAPGPTVPNWRSGTSRT